MNNDKTRFRNCKLGKIVFKSLKKHQLACIMYYKIMGNTKGGGSKTRGGDIPLKMTRKEEKFVPFTFAKRHTRQCGSAQWSKIHCHKNFNYGKSHCTMSEHWLRNKNSNSFKNHWFRVLLEHISSIQAKKVLKNFFLA